MIGKRHGLLLWTAISMAATTVGADERLAWHYTTGGKPIVIYQAREGEWEDVRPDDKDYVYDERQRTEEYIELQNRQTKLLIRLHSDRGFWRREPDEKWTRWVSGKWGAAPADVKPTPPAPSQPARDYLVRLAYFVPQDRVPLREYESKIRVVMAYTASLYQNDLRKKGFKTDGVRFGDGWNRTARASGPWRAARRVLQQCPAVRPGRAVAASCP